VIPFAVAETSPWLYYAQATVVVWIAAAGVVMLRTA
jgi:hypothetical protein